MTEPCGPTSLYVHIPFCQSRCFYCDFTTYVVHASVFAAYVDALCAEFGLLRRDYGGGRRLGLRTLYFGGGTPSLLESEQWRQIATALAENFELGDVREWTIEANPRSAPQDKFSELRRLGVNRISFGAQSYDDALLQALGRLHAPEDIDGSVAAARAAGFERISLDLMIGLPGQTLAQVEQAVWRAVATGATHVSVYGLKVEEGTPFARWQARGELPLPDEDAEADMYERAVALLTGCGYVQYEISNFARPTQACEHNLVYWRNQPWLAAGVGAHGYVDGVRYANVTGLSQYADLVHEGKRPVADTRKVDAQEAREDELILGLRLREGVSLQAFEERHGISLLAAFAEPIARLQALGRLRIEDGRLMVPPELFETSADILCEFVTVPS
ncbi:MAG: radical SAM family heme chaperone HemW [Firmicutes bacterium]|nr:radical SAM family heme chaperone HemW [Bacillota bacterium]